MKLTAARIGDIPERTDGRGQPPASCTAVVEAPRRTSSAAQVVASRV